EASLHELLHMESSLQRFYEDPSGLQPAPAVPVGPGTYTAYDPSVKREVSQKVDLVSRFYNADGFWPALGRLAAALSLIL
ncbi:hypothetical protein, partial [Salmonella enterica]|uniref:hypothetical protein n=1 Tax=Salmonella enterica TaxID=28901 RepID=UPI0020A43977